MNSTTVSTYESRRNKKQTGKGQLDYKTFVRNLPSFDFYRPNFILTNFILICVFNFSFGQVDNMSQQVLNGLQTSSGSDHSNHMGWKQAEKIKHGQSIRHDRPGLPQPIQKSAAQGLRISDDGRYFVDNNGKPFFWLGDTAWLMFSKLTRQEILTYLNDRQAKGFNVLQVMLLHSMEVSTVDGVKALIANRADRPLVSNNGRDYWDLVEFAVEEAGKRGMYMALVPIWGSNVKAGKINTMQAEIYSHFLALKFSGYQNIIWLNGGDLKGDEGREIWATIGHTLKKTMPHHLVTFHPRGRYSSADWFHDGVWLDFNMIQSGHKTYAQDTSSSDIRHFGEDNWKLIEEAYQRKPVKPVLDGEPSYESIPHGLHDTTQLRWHAADLRRYGYWSVLAGACGFTYGHNSVMQFYRKGQREEAAYRASIDWSQALNAEGASQMIVLKGVMESVLASTEIMPAPHWVIHQKDKYGYVPVLTSEHMTLAYAYTGAPFLLDATLMPRIKKAEWVNPRNGIVSKAKIKIKKGVIYVVPPAKGSDWLIKIFHS